MHRVLLFAGSPFQIYTYGAMLSLAILLSSAVFVPRARRVGLSEETALELVGIFILTTVLGGRVMHVALEWPEYVAHPLQMFNLREGGLALYGAIIGGSITLFAYARIKQIALVDLLDAAAPACILAQGIGRIGCFFNGCCYGKVAPLAWGVFFKDADPPTVGLMPRYPTQLYELAGDLALFFFLLWWSKRRHHRGEIFYLYLTVYAIIRFLIEFWRDEPIVAMGLTFAQWCGVVFFVFGFWGLQQVYLQSPIVAGLTPSSPESPAVPSLTPDP